MEQQVATPSPMRIDYSPAIGTLRAEILKRKAEGASFPPPRTWQRGEPWPPDYTAVQAWRQMQMARFELKPSLVESAKAYYHLHPEAFINHWIDTYDPRLAAKGGMVKIPMVMFPRQEDMVHFVTACIKAEANGLIEKTRDMGATWVAVGYTVALFLFGGGVSIGWGSQKEEKVDRHGDPSSVFEKIRIAIRSLPKQFLPEGFHPADLAFRRLVNRETGASVVGEIGVDIGRGGRTLLYFVDEAAHLMQAEAVEASLLENTRVRIDISSVSGLGSVFHRKREAGRDWSPGEQAVRNQTNVLVMDWSDHPTKTQEWYDERKTKLIGEGLRHVFAQEIDRDYAAAAQGVIVQGEWFDAALDAHEKLGFPDDEGGRWMGGLDIADGGIDKNALVKRQGVILKYADDWGDRDTGITTRKTISGCRNTLPIDLQYDCIGVGAGVKAEMNRLREEDKLRGGTGERLLLPKGLSMTPWDAGSGVLNPFDYVIKGDEETGRNRDFYGNLKAQGWWMLGRRFELTYRAITEGISVKYEDIISISTKHINKATILKLKKEICQPTAARSTGRLKLIVDKAPDGAKSPNLGDATMMCYWPVSDAKTRTISFEGVRKVT